MSHLLRKFPPNSAFLPSHNKCFSNACYVLYTRVEVRWSRKVSVMRWHYRRDLREPFGIWGESLRAEGTAGAKALTGDLCSVG